MLSASLAEKLSCRQERIRIRPGLVIMATFHRRNTGDGSPYEKGYSLLREPPLCKGRCPQGGGIDNPSVSEADSSPYTGEPTPPQSLRDSSPKRGAKRTGRSLPLHRGAFGAFTPPNSNFSRCRRNPISKKNRAVRKNCPFPMLSSRGGVPVRAFGQKMK